MLNMACTLFRLTPEEALAGATVHAARALGLTDRGTLAAGQRADIARGTSPSRPNLPIGSAATPCAGVIRGGQRRALGGMMDLWQLHRGDSPLVIDVPHSGTHVPDALAVAADRDCANASPIPIGMSRGSTSSRPTEGATLFCATHSRYVVDLNRDPSGAALYAGADNTELCPTRTFAGEAIYADGEAPSPAEVADRMRRVLRAVSRALAAEIARVRERHGFAVLLDGHSIRGEVPRFFAGRLPDLNLGTASGASCAPPLQAAATRVLAERGGLHARRQRALQGRLDHAPLRATARGRARAAAGNGAGLLHGRGAAVPWDAARASRLVACCSAWCAR